MRMRNSVHCTREVDRASRLRGRFSSRRVLFRRLLLRLRLSAVFARAVTCVISIKSQFMSGRRLSD